MHVGMAFEPAVVLGLVGIEIVEDDVNFLFLSVGFALWRGGTASARNVVKGSFLKLYA
jgi:hypothetical protein